MGNRPSDDFIGRVDQMERAYRRQNRVFRVLWLVTGFVIVATGLALLVLPGPAVIVIPIGLAMLAVEFAWARRMLTSTLEQGGRASDTARRALGRRRTVGVVALLLAGAAAAVAAFLLLD